MRNNKVKNIIRHNIKRNFKNKFFIALNIIFFIACIIALNFSEIGNFISENTDDTIIEIADKNGMLYNEILNKLSETEKLQISKVDKLVYDEENFESNRILVEAIYSSENILEVKIISSEIIDNELYIPIEEATTKVRNDIYAKNNNISESEMREIIKGADIETIIIENNDSYYEKYGIFFAIWSVTFFAVPFVLSSFSKEMFAEKTSKSSEYVLTTISSKEYMIIKIGTAFLNILIQGIAIVIYYLLGCIFKSFLTGESLLSIININLEIVKIIANVFVLYVPYMIIMLTVQMIMSSKASDSTSAESCEMVSTLIMMVSVMIPFMLNQYELLTLDFVYYFLAVIPMFSTFTIMPLMIFHNIGIIHTIIALILYALTIVIILKVAPNKIKNGILDYKPSKNKKEEEVQKDKKRNEKLKFELKRKAYTEKVSKYSMIIGFGIILYLVLAMFVLPLIVDPICYGIFENKVSQENISLISSIISGVLCLYLPAKLLDIYNSKKENKTRKNESKLKWFLMAIPFVVLIFWVQTFIMKKMIGTTTTETVEHTSYLLIFIRLVVVPAIFEELLFRKSIFNISKKQGLAFAVIISSILFGAIHLNFYQAIGATLAGIVFAIVAYKTGSLIPSIILHALVNGYSFFVNILWVNNTVAVNLINTLVIGFTIIGTVILLENVLKNKEKIKLKKKSEEKDSFDNPIVKASLLFSNFYFIFAVILLIVCFTINQEYMGMLM